MDVKVLHIAAQRVVALIKGAKLPTFVREPRPAKELRRCEKCGGLTRKHGPVCQNGACGGEMRQYLRCP